MIVQVVPEDYAKIRPFFQPVMFDMFVTAVLKNELLGRVYVDSIEQPTSGFIMTQESCLAVGDAVNQPFLKSLRQIFEKTVLVGDIVNPDNSEFVIGYVSGDWDPALIMLMDGWTHVSEQDGDTCHYLLEEMSFNWRVHLPQAYQIQQINSRDIHKQTMSMWVSIFDLAQMNTSPDFDKFMQHGFGFAVLHENEVVAGCLSDVVSGDRCEIGIVTAKNHRRKGLATAVTGATVEYALSIGMKEVNWQTGDDNWGSRKTAEKVGFRLNLLFPCRFFEPAIQENN